MIKNLILLLSLVTLLSCGGDDRRKELEIEKQNYVNGISSSHKTLIRNIFEKDIYLIQSNIPAKNSILVVEKENGEILPYTNINSILKDRGYNIAYNSSVLDYIIVVKFVWIKTGMYSNGSDAYDCKTLIYSIDSKTEKINLIESKTSVAPDKVRPYSSEDGHYGGAQYRGYKLADLIINNALK